MAEMKRRGIDVARFDRRPLGVIMRDEIPYAKWSRQFKMLKRAGFGDWYDFLRSKPEPG